MKPLTVVSVERYAPDDDAASVTLRSDQGEVTVFCWPCSVKAGDVVMNRLSAMDGEVGGAYGVDWPQGEKGAASAEQLERTGHYAYRGRGRVAKASEGLVETMGFLIEFGETPETGHVEFDIARLDCGCDTLD